MKVSFIHVGSGEFFVFFVFFISMLVCFVDIVIMVSVRLYQIIYYVEQSQYHTIIVYTVLMSIQSRY